MPLDFEALSNWDFEEIEQTLTERDTILYALGLGFGEDPTDKKELAYVYEDGLKAVPSMAVILGYPGFWLRDPKTGVNWQKVLHGEQWLDIYKPLPTSSPTRARAREPSFTKAVILSTRTAVKNWRAWRCRLSVAVMGGSAVKTKRVRHPQCCLIGRLIMYVISIPCRAKPLFIVSAVISIRFMLTRMLPVLSGSTARSCMVWRPMGWRPGRF